MQPHPAQIADQRHITPVRFVAGEREVHRHRPAQLGLQVQLPCPGTALDQGGPDLCPARSERGLVGQREPERVAPQQQRHRRVGVQDVAVQVARGYRVGAPVGPPAERRIRGLERGTAEARDPQHDVILGPRHCGDVEVFARAPDPNTEARTPVPLAQHPGDIRARGEPGAERGPHHVGLDGPAGCVHHARALVAPQPCDLFDRLQHVAPRRRRKTIGL